MAFLAAVLGGFLQEVRRNSHSMGDPYPLTFPSRLTQAGILPIRKREVRFAVGQPNGLTSNSWKFWANKKGDIYIACRDSFKYARVSLHVSGRWRMGFTTAALKENSSILQPGENRAWEVWDRPSPTFPKTTIAFRLYFPTSELAVLPEQRPVDEWREVIFIEPAPAGNGKLTALTLFMTDGDVEPRHRVRAELSLGLLGNWTQHVRPASGSCRARGKNPEDHREEDSRSSISNAHFWAGDAGKHLHIRARPLGGRLSLFSRCLRQSIGRGVNPRFILAKDCLRFSTFGARRSPRWGSSAFGRAHGHPR